MSNLRQAAQQALHASDALEKVRGPFDEKGVATVPFFYLREFGAAMEDLRAALAEPPCKTGASCTNKCQRCAEPEHRPDCALLKIPSRDCDCAKPDQDKFCDTHCTWRDHHPDCVRAEPEQKPVAWMTNTKVIDQNNNVHVNVKFNVNGKGEPLYIASTPRRPLSDEELDQVLERHAGGADWLDAEYRSAYALARAVIAAYEAKQGEQK